ncbi:MAG: hypothetical protein CK424_06820 [Legionella sp.]|nr:MAG: hypothetical protein CK424_06820 [Legionella sp.]
MKKWIGLSTVFAAVLAGSYYGMGVMTERTLKKNINILNQSDGVTVTLQHYHRGWFHSHADLKWTLQVPKKPDAQQNSVKSADALDKIYYIDIPLDIFHGPMIFSDSKLWFGFGYAHSNVVLPEVYEQQFQAVYDKNSTIPPLNISVFVNYLAKTTIQLNIPSFKLIAKAGKSKFKWMGMQVTINVSANKKHLQGNLLVKGFTWFHEGMKGIHGPVNSDFDLSLREDNLYLGTAHLNLPSLVLLKGQQQVLSLIDAHLTSTSDIKDGLYNTALSANINRASFQNRQYGPSSLEISVRNLDAVTLSKMNTKLNESSNYSDRDRQGVLLSLIPDLPALLCKGAQLKMSHLELNLPEGKLNAAINIELPNEQISNPFQLLQKINGEGKITVSPAVLTHWLQQPIRQKIVTKLKSELAAPSGPLVVVPQANVPAQNIEAQVIAKTAEKIQELISLGVLTQVGSDYVLNLKFSNGKLFVNDHPFTSSMLVI